MSMLEIIPKALRNAVLGMENTKNEGFGIGSSFIIFEKYSQRKKLLGILCQQFDIHYF